MAATGDAGFTTLGFVAWLVALTAISFLAIWLAARALTGRDAGLVAFILGIAAVVVALLMTIVGGFVIAPVLATIPLAASARARGGWYPGRLITSVSILAVTSVWYVLVVASYADFPDWL